MQLPIGYDNFRKIIDNKLDFVDKSLLIKDLIDDTQTEVVLITRPRRFGKTLNLSLLEHFLAADVNGQATAGLFDHLKIARVADGIYMQHQGQYPVISISFKDIKDNNFDVAMSKLQELIIKTYTEHSYLESSHKLGNNQQQFYKLILSRTANQGQLENALQMLCNCLYQHHGKKPWLLIDEYDTPVHASFQHSYYDEMISFMRNLLGAALKTNPYLEKAVITGILRVSKESLFSGLNNIEVYSLLRKEYSQYFGFTEQEVSDLLQEAHLTEKAEAIKQWYNGYQFGNTVVYNPWSIVNCIKRQGELCPYWVNTSDNALIKKLFATADNLTKIKLESLVRNEPIEALVDEYVSFSNFAKNPSALWSLLLSSGYLKATACERADDKLKCELLPPNYEVSLVYRALVKEWLSDPLGQEQYDYFIASLLKGHITDFTKMLKKFLVETLSVFDVTGHNPERFYHGFVVGLISSTLRTHIIKSNRESGYGRYDVMIMPKEITTPDAMGLILEFKVAEEDEDLKESAKEALQQIEQRGYEAEVRQAGLHHIIKVGLAFCGKKVEVVFNKNRCALAMV